MLSIAFVFIQTLHVRSIIQMLKVVCRGNPIVICTHKIGDDERDVWRTLVLLELAKVKLNKELYITFPAAVYAY